MKFLVVVDMQNDFIDGALGTPDAQAIVGDVVQKIKEFDGAIVATQDTHQQNYLQTQEGQLLPVVHCVENTDGWKLNQSVFDAVDAKYLAGTPAEVFFKPTFGSTDLGEWLVEKDIENHIDEVVLVGLCTDICVISNALLIKAYLPETKITVDAACCAGVTPESHANALRAMQVCQVSVENWEG